MSQAFIVVDQQSGTVVRIEAVSYVGVLEKVLGDLNIEVMEEGEFSEKEPERYQGFIDQGLL